MLSHGYIENDFDVFEWAAPEFLEKAAAELLQRRVEVARRREAARSHQAGRLR